MQVNEVQGRIVEELEQSDVRLSSRTGKVDRRMLGYDATFVNGVSTPMSRGRGLWEDPASERQGGSTRLIV